MGFVGRSPSDDAYDPPASHPSGDHVHSEPGHQLALGLYGASLVLDPARA
jgi:hypothetical protein